MTALLILKSLYLKEEKQLSESNKAESVNLQVGTTIPTHIIQKNVIQHSSATSPFLSYSFDKLFIDDEECKILPVIKKELKFDEIESEIGLKVVKIKLISLNDVEEHYFEIAKGTIINANLFPHHGITLDIITNEKILNSKIKDRRTDSFEDLAINENRVLMINFNFDFKLFINDSHIKANIIGDSLSFQMYLPNLKDGKFFYKEIKQIEYDQICNIYEKFKDLAENFFLKVKNELANTKNEQDNNEKFINEILSYHELIKGFNMKLNLPKNVLFKKFNKKEYFDFISSCCLYFILSSLENIKMKEIINIFKLFIDYKNILENDLNLEYYLRNILITEFSKKLEKIKNEKDFNSINFRYYIRNHLKKNSPLDSAITFLENIVNDLDEQSPFFYPLVLIDSGLYYYNTTYKTEFAYGYGINSYKLLISHLNDIIPEVIITYNDKKYFENDQGLTEKSSGAVSLNLDSELLLPLKNINLYEPINNIDSLNNLSLRIFFVLFHEVLGHKKSGFSYTNEDLQLSPNFFYDKKNNTIMKLVHCNSKGIGKNIIKILRDPDSNSDSGSFLEYFLGECEYGFISYLIEELLINNIDINFIFKGNLWNKDIKILQHYIKLKYLIFKTNKSLFEEKNFDNIEEEINYLKENIKKFNLKDEYPIKIKNEYAINIGKERKRKGVISSDTKRINFHEYDHLTIKDIKNLYTEKNTNYEEKMLLKELLLFRTERK